MVRRHPIARHSWKWASVILTLAILVGLIVLAYMTLFPENLTVAIIVGAAVYFAYSQISKRVLARHHFRGMRRLQQGRYDEALGAFEQYLAFIERHPWIDRYRALVMLTAEAYSCRESAMNNIIFCYGQMGQVVDMKAWLHKLIDEYPSNVFAVTTLSLIKAIESSVDSTGGGKGQGTGVSP